MLCAQLRALRLSHFFSEGLSSAFKVGGETGPRQTPEEQRWMVLAILVNHVND